MLVVGCCIFDVLWIEREGGGLGQETMSIAPAHVRSYDKKYKDKGAQPSEPKNRPGKRFITEETVPFWLRDSAGGGNGIGACHCVCNGVIRTAR